MIEAPALGGGIEEVAVNAVATWPVAVEAARPGWRETFVGYAYLLPALVILAGFHFIPILYALYISLFNWRIRQGPFVGLDNYATAVTTPDFWDALKVSAFYAAGVVPGTIILSVLDRKSVV